MAFKRKPPQGNVRRVRTTGKNIRGVITSKTGRTVQYESLQEFKLILLLERDASVVDYISQPLVIEFNDRAGKRHTYTPDFQVLRVDGTIEIHEVTLNKRSARVELQERHQAGRTYCQGKGWKFVLHLEQDLPLGMDYANLTVLLGFKAKAYYVETIATATRQLLAGGPANLAALISQVAHLTEAPYAMVSGCLLHLLWLNCLRILPSGLLFLEGYLNPEILVSLA